MAKFLVKYDSLDEIRNLIIGFENGLRESGYNDDREKQFKNIVDKMNILCDKVEPAAKIYGMGLVNNTETQRRSHKSQRNRAINRVVKRNYTPGIYKEKYRFKGLKNKTDHVTVEVLHPGFALSDGKWIIGYKHVKPKRTLSEYLQHNMYIVYDWIHGGYPVQWVESAIHLGVDPNFIIIRSCGRYKSLFACAILYNRFDVAAMLLKYEIDPCDTKQYVKLSLEDALRIGIKNENERATLKMKIMLKNK